MESIKNHRNIFGRDVGLDKNVVKNGYATFAEESPHLSSNFAMIVRVVESILRYDKIKCAALKLTQVVKVRIDNFVLLVRYSCFVCLLFVEDVFVVAYICSNDLIQHAEFQ